MTLKKEHKVLLWSAAAIGVVILLWSLLHRSANAAQAPGTTVQIGQGPGYSVPGNNYTINRPPDGWEPAVYNLGDISIGPSYLGTMLPGPPCGCECGCNNAGNIFTFPEQGIVLSNPIPMGFAG